MQQDRTPDRQAPESPPRGDREPYQEEIPEEELVAEGDEVIGVALRRSLIALIVLALLGGGVLLVVRRSPGESVERRIDSTAPEVVVEAASPPAVSFSDVTQEAGIDFVHTNGAEGERLLPETMGAGAAFLDYDNDGDSDLLLVNSAHWPHGRSSAPPPTMALFENGGRGSFSDVTESVGLAVSYYGTGVGVGDVDNDGWSDLFIAAVGSNHLYRNVASPDGGRRFVELRGGVEGGASDWSTSSAFLDYDNDGDLDLFVGNYVVWSRQIDLEVNYTLVGVGRAYGPPVNYRGTFSKLYRNRGDGTFDDVSAEAGIQVREPATGEPAGKALGVVVVDVDEDGWVDLFVANDTVRNFFFHNRGDGTFEESAQLFGLAYGSDGAATGAMGVDVGDYRNDGEIGFAIGNFANEMTSLYVSQGDRTLYTDQAIGEGVGAPSRRMLTFGLFLFDYDLDGRLDLLQCNGHLEQEIGAVDPSQTYRQAAQLFWNAGSAGRGTFVPVDPASTGDLARPIVGRGASYSDIDADGDLDVLLLQTGGPPLLLRNEQQLGHHWLRLRLRGNGSTSNRDAIGAVVEIEADGRSQRRFVSPARSYQSSVEPVVSFGLGASSRARVRVRWPDGTVQEVGELEADQEVEIRQPLG